ncbi:MAG: hypothetical protein ACRD5H_14405 [Nitrososphaerales archaeon]
MLTYYFHEGYGWHQTPLMDLVSVIAIPVRWSLIHTYVLELGQDSLNVGSAAGYGRHNSSSAFPSLIRSIGDDLAHADFFTVPNLQTSTMISKSLLNFKTQQSS